MPVRRVADVVNGRHHNRVSPWANSQSHLPPASASVAIAHTRSDLQRISSLRVQRQRNLPHTIGRDSSSHSRLKPPSSGHANVHRNLMPGRLVERDTACDLHRRRLLDAKPGSDLVRRRCLAAGLASGAVGEAGTAGHPCGSLPAVRCVADALDACQHVKRSESSCMRSRLMGRLNGVV